MAGMRPLLNFAVNGFMLMLITPDAMQGRVQSTLMTLLSALVVVLVGPLRRMPLLADMAPVGEVPADAA